MSVFVPLYDVFSILVCDRSRKGFRHDNFRGYEDVPKSTPQIAWLLQEEPRPLESQSAGPSGGDQAKCLDAKRIGKALANNVAALQRSREHWKALVREHRDEVEQLRQELEQIKNSPR